MYHTAQTGAPCLSFDILRDSLGDGRVEYPLTAYLVAGTQADGDGEEFRCPDEDVSVEKDSWRGWQYVCGEGGSNVTFMNTRTEQPWEMLNFRFYCISGVVWLAVLCDRLQAHENFLPAGFCSCKHFWQLEKKGSHMFTCKLRFDKCGGLLPSLHCWILNSPCKVLVGDGIGRDPFLQNWNNVKFVQICTRKGMVWQWAHVRLDFQCPETIVLRMMWIMSSLCVSDSPVITMVGLWGKFECNCVGCSLECRSNICLVLNHVTVTWPSGDDEETLDDDEPQLDTVMVQHPGAVNRIRVSV